MSAESPSSRLSKTNRAGPQNGPERSSQPDSRFVPLTEEDGVTLRREVQAFDVLDRNAATSWTDAISQYDSYLTDREDVKTVFQDPDGETVKASNPHRFAPDYADKQYAKLKDLERGLSSDYGKRLHTVMLTFTASSQPDGDPIPPVDHLNELDASWDAIRRALSRQLGDRRWEYLAILEPHTGDGVNNGYLHIHLAVFVDGKVTSRTFEPVIRAHLRNCDLAGEDAHDVTDDSTISVRHAGRDRDLDNQEQLDELAIYLAEYLGTYGDDPKQAPEPVRAANAVLWATGKQRWRPSNGAQSYMASPSSDSDEDWELIGVEKDGELLPAGGDTGGVDTFTTGVDPPPVT